MENYTKFQDITLIEGKKSGKTIVILGGIHGNEPSGVLLIKKLLQGITTIDSGRLYLILGNPPAIQKQVRFVDSNMNRSFSDSLIPQNYEEERSITIREIIKTADLVIDIHNTIRENTEPFIITEYQESQFVYFFEPQYIVHGLVNLHPGSTDGYGRTHGIESLCIEAGSMHNPLPLKNIYSSIISILINQNMIFNYTTSILQYKNKKHLIAKEIIKAKSLSWNFSKERGDFDFLKKGTIIGYEDGKAISAPYDGYTLFPKLPHNINDEVLVFAIVENNK